MEEGKKPNQDDLLIDSVINVPLPRKKARFAFIALLRTGYEIIERKYPKAKKAALVSIFIGCLMLLVGMILSFSSADAPSLGFLIGGLSLIVLTVAGRLWHAYREGMDDKEMAFENVMTESILGKYLPGGFEMLPRIEEQNDVSVGRGVCAVMERCCPKFFRAVGWTDKSNTDGPDSSSYVGLGPSSSSTDS